MADPYGALMACGSLLFRSFFFEGAIRVPRRRGNLVGPPSPLFSLPLLPDSIEGISLFFPPSLVPSSRPFTGIHPQLDLWCPLQSRFVYLTYLGDSSNTISIFTDSP